MRTALIVITALVLVWAFVLGSNRLVTGGEVIDPEPVFPTPPLATATVRPPTVTPTPTPGPSALDTLPPKSTAVVIEAQLEALGSARTVVVIRFTAVDQSPDGVQPSLVTRLEVVEDGERLPCRIRDRCTVRETVPGVHIFEFWAVDFEGNEEEHQMLLLEMDETSVSVRFP